MYKDKVLFDFGLPLAVELGRLDENPAVILREHVTIILVIEGKILFDNVRHAEVYEKGDIYLLECDSPVKVSKQNKAEAMLILLSFDNSHYSLKFPYVCAAAFRKNPKTIKKNLLKKIINMVILVLMFESRSYAALEAKSSRLLAEIVRYHQFYSENLLKKAADDKQTQEYINFMEELMNYIGANYRNKATLNSFAAASHLSSNYLSHTIKKISGWTFQELLSFIRCIKSQEFLLDEKCKEGRLAIDMGFSSSTYYTKNFIRYFGVSPCQYRESFGIDKLGKIKYDRKKKNILSLIKAFADQKNISISFLNGIRFTHNICDVNTNIEIYKNVLSDMGRISNIRTQMTETAHMMFEELHKSFRISIITIDVESSLKKIEPGTLYNISRNINGLLSQGFTVALETKNLSRQNIKLIADFFEFYSKIYRDNISIIKVLIRMDLPEKQMENVKKTFAANLFDMIGLNIEIISDSAYMSEINYINELYDSFVITPFAMDELFNPQNWNREIAFSLIDEVNVQGMFLKGGNGLLAWNGVKKPWWYAYIMASKLYGVIVDKGEDHIITNDNGRIAILSFNKCGQEGSMLSKINSASQLDEAIENGKNMRREHSFHLTNIYGTIKATHYSLNKDTCLYSKWAELNFKESITGEEESIMSAVCHPDISFKVLEARGELDITTIENTFGVSLIVLEKI